jgi:predicted nucleic acid-binding Zn ribbon protein
MGNTPLAICEDCGKEIKGRSDNRFCDDTCRNNFNRKKRQAEQFPITDDALEIIRTIKRNYQLLKNKNLAQDESTFQLVENQLTKGFNPNYFTSILEVDGELYYFCFESGFRIADGIIYIIERPEQMQL